MHLSDHDMVRLAIEVDADNQLEGKDLELAEHIFSCGECQNKFAICMNYLKFLKPDSLEKYFADNLPNSNEEISTFQVLQENLLYKMQIIIGRTKEQIKCFTEFMSKGLPQFNVTDSYAYTRGNDSNEIEIVADDSIIVYNSEKEKLTISLDEEIYGGKTLLAHIEIDGEKRKSEFVNDGHGMIEAIFENIKRPEEIKISIMVKDKCL